jgi:hypothetical protein
MGTHRGAARATQIIDKSDASQADNSFGFVTIFRATALARRSPMALRYNLSLTKTSVLDPRIPHE